MMSAITQVTASKWTWPADVLTFADEHGLTAYLEPFRQATLKLFPTMSELRVFVEADREFTDMRYIVFEARVPNCDLDNYLELDRGWSGEWYRVAPNRESRQWVMLALIPVNA